MITSTTYRELSIGKEAGHLFMHKQWVRRRVKTDFEVERKLTCFFLVIKDCLQRVRSAGVKDRK